MNGKDRVWASSIRALKAAAFVMGSHSPVAGRFKIYVQAQGKVEAQLYYNKPLTYISTRKYKWNTVRRMDSNKTQMVSSELLNIFQIFFFV